MDKTAFFKSKKFLSMQSGLVAILITMEWFEDFFKEVPHAVYVIIPSITLLSVVYAIVEMSVDKARAKNGGNNDRQPKT